MEYGEKWPFRETSCPGNSRNALDSHLGTALGFGQNTHFASLDSDSPLGDKLDGLGIGFAFGLKDPSGKRRLQVSAKLAASTIVNRSSRKPRSKRKS